jgi:hypothetical protein
MNECRISDLVSEALDMNPWGVCTPLGTLDVPQRIPSMESDSIWIKTIISPNVELGQKEFLGSSLILCMEPQMFIRKSCALNGWMRKYARFHHQNPMIYGSIESPWLDLKWVERKLQSELRFFAALQTLKLTCALTGSDAHSTMDTPKKYGETPGWYLLCARVCLSTPKLINDDDFLQKSTKQ